MVSVERSIIFSRENLLTVVDDSVEVRGSEIVDLAPEPVEEATGQQVDELDEADEDKVLEALTQAPETGNEDVKHPAPPALDPALDPAPTNPTLPPLRRSSRIRQPSQYV